MNTPLHLDNPPKEGPFLLGTWKTRCGLRFFASGWLAAICILVLALAGTSPVSAGSFALLLSGDGQNDPGGWGVATDSANNVYTTGQFQGTADLDPGPGTLSVVSAGQDDTFVTKFDSNGNLVWGRAIGGSGSDIPYGGLVVDGSGNVYVTGYFGGTADFDPGAGTFNLTATAPQDTFVLKLDTNGNFVWAGRVGGNRHANGDDIALDPITGDILVAGSFLGSNFGTFTIDFDPDPSDTFNLTGGFGGDAGFVFRLTAAGDFIWAKLFTGDSSSPGRANVIAVAVSSTGEIYTTGRYSGEPDFDPGSGVVNLPVNPTDPNNLDAFVAKLNADGDLLWAASLGGGLDSTPGGASIAVDSAGNAYSVGLLHNGAADFDPGPGVFNLVGPTGLFDRAVYVSKLDTNGNFVWAKQIDTINPYTSPDISLDGSANAHITGAFTGTAVDFDPNAGVTTLNSSTGTSFMTKLDSAGDFIWARNFGGNGSPRGGIALDTAGNPITTGVFIGTADFDPGAGIVNLTSTVGSDGFVLKLDPNGDFTVVTMPEIAIFDGPTITTQSGVITLPITLDGAGDEFALSGSIHFDPVIFSNPQLTVGAGAPANMTLTQNLGDAGLGHVGFLLGLPFGETFAAGSQEILELQLTVSAQAPKVSYEITFGDAPGLREVVNDLAETIEATWTSGTVDVVNRDPDAVDDAENTDEDTVLNIAAEGVLSNDSDPDFGDVLTVAPLVTAATTPGGATISINADGSFGYDPTGSVSLNALPFGGSFVDTINYSIDDSDGGSDTATLSVTVAGVNDAPIANDDTGATTEEHVALSIPVPGVLGNDSDPDTGDTFAIDSFDATSANGATVVLNPDGSFSYDSTTAPAVLALAEGANLVDTFTYTIEDAGGLQDTATVSVAVSGVEFEGDVTPRPNGDNSIDVTDAVMVAKFVIGLETPAVGEFSRADSSPRNVGGNGKLTAADWVQTLRYAVGFDPVRRLLGPTVPAGPLLAAQVREARDEADPGKAKISIVPSVSSNGNVELAINMDSTGQVSALGFSIAFDPEIHRYNEHTFANTNENVTAFVNTDQAKDGRLGVVIANGDVAQTFMGGKISLLNLNLTTISRSRLKTSIIQFEDLPASRAVSDTKANKIDTEYVGASLRTSAPDSRTLPQTWLSSYFDPADLSDASKEETVWGADADPDGDGQSNYEEYVAGTSPIDGKSIFTAHIDKGAQSGNAVTISFYPYLEDRNYRLLFKSDLEVSSSWIEVYSGISSRYWQRSPGTSSGEGRSTTISTNGKTGFFRVEVELPTP